MLFLLTVILSCAVSIDAKRPAVSDLSIEQTQTLLNDMRLSKAFGKAFLSRKINGLALAVLQKGDLVESEAPAASALHFRMLWAAVEKLQSKGLSSKQAALFPDNRAKRRLAKFTPPDTDGYVGVRIRDEQAVFSMGKNQDVTLARTGKRKLTILANTKVVGDMEVEDLKVNIAQTGGGVSIKDMTSALARVKALEDQLDSISNKGGGDFTPESILGQVLVEAVCTTAQYGGSGQTHAIRRDCKGTKTCADVCKAVGYKCIESVHLYGNDAHAAVGKKGLRTHLYSSCTTSGCGPNYCCCTKSPTPLLDFDRYNVLGQVLVESVCTSIQSSGGTGQTHAIRRVCGGSKTCDDVCLGVSLQCIESIHMYANDGHDKAGTKGLQTHLYGSCSSSGCGPNYCCCTSNPAAKANLVSFDATSVVAQSLIAAVCTAMQFGGTGQTHAIRRQCSGTKTCAQICTGLGYKCQESIHMYGSDGHTKVETKGIRTHLYGSCTASGCGPNYCCCTQAPVLDKSDTDFDPSNVLGQLLVNAVCTSVLMGQGGSGHTASIRRKCSGSKDCDAVCKAQGLKCQDSVHMYGNDAATGVEKKGIKTYVYGSCKSTGCGPNYCCCTSNPGKLTDALKVVGISPTGGLSQGGLIAQSIVHAACVGAYGTGSGQVAVFKKPCSGPAAQIDCNAVCKKMSHGSCRQSYHMYGSTAHQADFTKGFFTHLYGGCTSKGCGPNYCCCKK